MCKDRERFRGSHINFQDGYRKLLYLGLGRVSEELESIVAEYKDASTSKVVKAWEVNIQRGK